MARKSRTLVSSATLVLVNMEEFIAGYTGEVQRTRAAETYGQTEPVFLNPHIVGAVAGDVTDYQIVSAFLGGEPIQSGDYYYTWEDLVDKKLVFNFNKKLPASRKCRVTINGWYAHHVRQTSHVDGESLIVDAVEWAEEDPTERIDNISVKVGNSYFYMIFHY